MSDADDLVAKIRAIADEVEGTATSVTERAQAAVDKAEQAVSKFKTALQSIMDNIAWIAGLPAVLGGGFGFLKSKRR
jgi:type VII secretion effector (TIGR04197 family)